MTKSKALSSSGKKSASKDRALELAQRVQRIKPSATLAISAKAKELKAAGKPIIDLSAGEPDFDTPEHIKNAAIQAIQDGHTHYTPVDGIPALKKAIISKFETENNLHYEPQQILVSCGAKHSLFNLFNAILNQGDEVIIPAPYWVSYPDMVKLCDGEPVIVKTDFSQSFKMTPAQLNSSITKHTRIVILNSPSNPTGINYTKDELYALGEVIAQHPGIIVISDDIYEHNRWSKTPFNNIVNAYPALYDRTIVINGVSKAYAMTGWRIGYAAGPAKIIAAMKKAQSQSTSNPASISQYAALAALSKDQLCVSEMTAEYKKRHDFVISKLEEIKGIDSIPSDGTFYTFPCITGLYNKEMDISNDMELAEFLLNEANLAIVPGSAFGAPGHIRMSYAVGMDTLKEAMKRLKDAAAKLVS